ncbi:hypothetical protein [Salibacterium salarium]|uniref:hypothetical protein n=1 Tax=Salibacterium salarium TaxID=284579 RepID=UPI00163A50C0|nr:hypothetical protein [Salibacterium salarium]
MVPLFCGEEQEMVRFLVDSGMDVRDGLKNGEIEGNNGSLVRGHETSKLEKYTLP